MVLLMMAPLSQKLEPPANPGRFNGYYQNFVEQLASQTGLPVSVKPGFTLQKPLRTMKEALDTSMSGNVGVQVSSWPVWAHEGDIYALIGDREVRLTETGNNWAPFNIGNGIVRFASSRRRRQPLAYDVDVSNPDDCRLAYADQFLYEMLPVTGESLAEGGANAAITTTPPDPVRALKFKNGPIGRGNLTLVNELVPLAEQGRETLSTAFARALLSRANDRTLLLAGQAWGGADYSQIKKEGKLVVYSKIIDQVGWAAARPGGVNVRAVTCIHGEADGIISNDVYDLNLSEFRSNLDSDIREITGQSNRVVLIFCQTSSAAYYRSASARHTFTTPLLQLKASRNDPNLFLMGPKYQFDYNKGSIDSHIDAPSTSDLGELYAKVYHEVCILGNDWEPTSPKRVSGTNVVIIDFHVPFAPLVFDTDWINDTLDYGFKLTGAASCWIASIAITDAKQVTIVVSDAPEEGWELSYAFENGSEGHSGRIAGARGCLRDSDATIAHYTGRPLPNWCVAFKLRFTSGAWTLVFS